MHLSEYVSPIHQDITNQISPFKDWSMNIEKSSHSDSVTPLRLPEG